ncbi:response regulator [Desulfovibrio gilichinskyi]|uniref:Sensory/regulatory protein RpfC n=1 Tax=Desulfovibrio gilichinskyi TaxID=1519643 RepID=A0A1X7E9F9_9BACT|nr:response regulator [Desulfovibrio gilichinskyi]SMF30066.1 PAS domain S-box-containing protein [Desulfovibrio gilichinskyi]
MANLLFHGSIRKKIIVLVLLATLPAFMLNLGTALLHRHQAIKSAKHQTLESLHEFSEIQRRISDSTRTLLQTVAEIPEIRELNPHAAQITLETILKANPIYTNAILINLEGNVVAAGTGNATNLNFADRKQFKDAISTKKFAAGEYVVGKTSQKSIFPFAMPVLNANGNPKGALIIGINLNHYRDFFKRSNFPENSFFGLCDHNGNRLFRYPKKENIEVGTPIQEAVFLSAKTGKNPGMIVTESTDKIVRIIFYEPLRLSSDTEPYMYLFLGIDESEIQQGADLILTRGAETGFISIILTLAIAWFVGGRGIVRHLESLTETVQKIGSKDFKNPSGIDYSDGEIGQLGQAFDNMVNLLRKREKERNNALASVRESNERSRTLLLNTPSGICLVNPVSQFIEFMNPAFMDIFNVHDENLKNLQLKAFHPQKDSTKVDKIFEKHILHEISFSPALPAMTLNGREICVDVSSAIVTINGRNLLALFFTDITAHKHSENELIGAKEVAERANRVKDEFLANISHEIRTPLNGVMGTLQLMQETPLDSEQESYVEIALGSSNNLLKVLNDLLDFSKIEAGKLDIIEEPFELESLIEESVNLFQFQARENNISFHSHIDPSTQKFYIGDIGRIRQILFNLIGNSIKFTESGSIAVQVYSLPHRDPNKERLFFSVEDTGVGISDDKIGYIFESFTQVDGALSRKHQGTGLGLPIVKRLVNLMGGNITVETEVGVGTTILFCVLVTKTDYIDIQDKKDHQRKKSDTPLRILLVEDEMVNRIMAQKLLEKAGHSIICAQNGEECLEKLRKHSFDVILMDVQMPVMDGFETTNIIRNSKEFSKIAEIPIVALTAHASNKDLNKAKLTGMDEFVSKPFNKEVLLEVLQKMHDLNK